MQREEQLASFFDAEKLWIPSHLSLENVEKTSSTFLALNFGNDVLKFGSLVIPAHDYSLGVP